MTTQCKDASRKTPLLHHHGDCICTSHHITVWWTHSSWPGLIHHCNTWLWWEWSHTFSLTLLILGDDCEGRLSITCLSIVMAVMRLVTYFLPLLTMPCGTLRFISDTVHTHRQTRQTTIMAHTVCCKHISVCVSHSESIHYRLHRLLATDKLFELIISPPECSGGRKKARRCEIFMVG